MNSKIKENLDFKLFIENHLINSIIDRINTKLITTIKKRENLGAIIEGKSKERAC
jgi:hypothetical protein